ncbi:hypothetical protein D2Q93_05050 [Alicyclobacillaceae bacterium I2511]|nr:hypothetical protein D2Q93_05050 [Alicyclobacillaceae bacterium I2511]
MGKVKRRAWFIALVAVLASGWVWFSAWVGPSGDVARANSFSFSNATLALNGHLVVSTKGVVHQGTTYFPIWYLMHALSAVGVNSTWDHGDWNITTASLPVNPVDATEVGNGNSEISLNGIVMKRVSSLTLADSSSRLLTTYMPMWYVMQVLGKINIASSWDGNTWKLFTQVPETLMQAYQRRHPHAIVSFAQGISLSPQGTQAVMLENTATFTQGSVHPLVLSIVTPNQQVYDFPTQAQWVVGMTQMPQQAMVAVTDGAGAHNELLYLFKFTATGQPELVQSFVGDNGVALWLQDGTPLVEVSQRTYNWNLMAPNGSKDDSAYTQVYQYNGHSFQQTDMYETGVFDTQPTLQTNPQVDAYNALTQMQSALQATNSSDGQWDHNIWTSTFLTEFIQQRPYLGFLWPSHTAVTASLTTVAANGQKADYLYQQGGHSLLLSLVNDPTWQVTGFTLDPSAPMLAQLRASGGI